MKRKRSGPSCLGSLVLLAVIVLGLKILYDNRDETVVNNSFFDTQQSENYDTSITDNQLYNKLYSELSSYATEVEFDYDCTDELFDTFEQVCADHPELFWLNGSGSSKKSTRGTDVSVVLTPEPVATLVELLKFREDIDSVIQSIHEKVNAEWTDYEKILFIHDYLVENTDYDTDCANRILNNAEYADIWQSCSAYGCLVDGLAVCSGYAAAFQLLLNEFDIPCFRISGIDNENGTPHEWNCVQIGENWYYVDVTWDDPTFMNENSAFKDQISHEYFLINEQTLSLTHTINKEKYVPKCTDNGYSYYVQNNKNLDLYDYELALEMINVQSENDIIEIKFSTVEEAEKAKIDLFENSKFYDIESIKSSGVSSISYSIGKTGLLRIKLVREISD